MRIKTSLCYKYRVIAGQHYLIPVAEAADKSVIPLQLTETAAWIWAQLETGEDTEKVAALMAEEYEVDLCDAKSDTENFAELLIKQGMAEKV